MARTFFFVLSLVFHVFVYSTLQQKVVFILFDLIKIFKLQSWPEIISLLLKIFAMLLLNFIVKLFFLWSSSSLVFHFLINILLIQIYFESITYLINKSMKFSYIGQPDYVGWSVDIIIQNVTNYFLWKIKSVRSSIHNPLINCTVRTLISFLLNEASKFKLKNICILSIHKIFILHADLNDEKDWALFLRG